MSYAQRAALGDTGGVRVGQGARSDAVLAKASLLASQILVKVTRLPKADRKAVAAGELNKLSPGLGSEWKAELAKQISEGRKRDQAVFDSMRLVIANRYFDRGVELLRGAMASDYGWDSMLDVPGLGDDTARDVGCTVAGGVSMVTGLIGSIYGGPSGGAAANGGSSLIAGGLDCNRRDREAQLTMSNNQVAQAQTNLALAQQQAAAQLAAEQSRSETTKTMVFVGVGGAVVITALIMVLK